MTSQLHDLGPDPHIVRLPPSCGTVVAEDLRVQLVMAIDFGGCLKVDASAVETIGQAVLQLIVAARVEAAARGGYELHEPSAAFVERVTSCLLAGPVGLPSAKDLLQ